MKEIDTRRSTRWAGLGAALVALATPSLAHGAPVPEEEPRAVEPREIADPEGATEPESEPSGPESVAEDGGGEADPSVGETISPEEPEEPEELEEPGRTPEVEPDATSPDESAQEVDPLESSPEPTDDADPAETEEDDPGLEELEGLLDESVVAGASRITEAGDDAPAMVQVVTATELRAYGIRTLDEAFNYLGIGISSEPGGGPAYETGVRGITLSSDFGNHILVRIDGHVVSDPNSGLVLLGPQSGIPIDLIDRIEFIYGPGGVLYGNNAMLMVVDIAMKKGEQVGGVEVSYDQAISPAQNRYGNPAVLEGDGLGHRERLAARFGRSFRIGKQDGEILLHGAFMSDQEPEYVLGSQYDPVVRDLFDFGPDTGSGDPTVWGGRAGPRFRGPNAYGRLRLGDFTLSGRTAWTRVRTPYFGLTFGENSFNNLIATSYLDARYDYVVSPKVSGTARLYTDHNQFRQTFALPSQLFCGQILAPCVVRVGTEGIRGGLESQWRFDWFADGRFLTLLGVDGRVRDYKQRVSQEDPLGNVTWIDEDTADITDGAVGAYLQQIAKVHPIVTLNAGLRYDYFTYADAFSPRGAVVLRPWKGGSLKLLYSQAFRAPSRQELQVDGQLGPEIVRQGEVSLTQRVGVHRLVVSGFGGAWTDLIQRYYQPDPDNPGRNVVHQRNANQLRHLGGSVGYSAQLDKLSYGISATYGWARTRLEGDPAALTDDQLQDIGFSRAAVEQYGRDLPLGGAPGVTGNARIAYAFGPGRPTVAFASYLVGPRLIADVLSYPSLVALTEDGARATVPARVTARLVLTHSLRRWRWGGLDYRLGIEGNTNTRSTVSVGPFRGWTMDDNQTREIELVQIPRMTVFAGLTLYLAGRGAR